MGIPNLHTQPVKITRVFSVIFAIIMGSLFTTTHLQAQSTCDNVTNGGSISGNETGCANPTFDPSPITSIQAPTGGSGTIEYLWMKTTGDTSASFNAWDIIPGAKGDTYDPSPISTTTHYARCSRRSSCVEYNGETNIITKTIQCCNIDVSINRLGGSSCTNEVPLSASAPAGSTVVWTASSGSFDNPSSRTPLFTASASGTVTISLTATGPDGCEGTSNLPIAIGGLEATTSISQPSCGERNGSVTVTVTGGAAPLQYDWGNAYPDAPTLSNVGKGVYIVVVRDANGCSATATAELSNTGDLDISFQSQNASCNGASDGTILLQANNGTFPYIYQWPNNISTSATASNLATGNYQVTVSDATGCTNVANISISEPTPIQATISTTNSCEATGGQATVSVAGGSPGYSYTWNDPTLQGSSTVSNLPNGTYTVTVTDAAGCTATATASISTNSLAISASATQLGCGGQSGGSASVSVTTGTAPYSYSWSNGITNLETISNLSEGAYSVTVMDAAGCTATATTTVSNNTLTINANATSTGCNGSSNGTANVSIIKGTAPYSYAWSNGVTNVETISGLSEGAYSVTVTDAAGCTATTSTTVSGNSLTISATATPTGCNGSSIGTASVSIIEGTAPYSYSWSNGLTNTTTITNLSAGNYTVTATDATGCTATSNVSVTSESEFDIIVNSEDATCSENNGRAVVNYVGPDQIYSYLWNDINNTRSSAAENLTPGVYTVTVTAPSGCSVEKPISVGRIVSEFEASIQSNVTTICLDEYVELSALIRGEATSYAWSSSNGEILNPSSNATSYVGSVEGEQTISLLVTDAHGCQKNPTITINVVNAFGGDIVADKSGICLDDNIQELITVTLTGTTTATNTFVITDESDNIIGVQTDNQFDFESEEAGVCFIRNVNYDPSLTSGLVIGQNLSSLTGCFGMSNAVRIDRYSGADCKLLCTLEGGNISTGDVPVVCVGDGSPDLINVAVAGNTGNFSTWVITDIHETLLFLPTQPPFNFEETGEGIVYIWHISSNQPLEGLVIGSSLTNLPGCGVLSNNSIKVDRRTATSFSITQSNASLCPNSTIQLITDWTNDYGSFSWSATSGSFDDNTSATPIFTPAGSGSYTITARLFDGVCTSTATTTVTVQESIAIASNVSNETCVGDGNGQIDVSVSGGIAPYTYAWSDGSTSSLIAQLNAGTYGVTVTDANGCTATSSIAVSNTSNLSAQAGTQSLVCFDDNSGVIRVEATGGAAPYTYLWNGQPNNSSLANLAAGVYNIEVRDSVGCSVSLNPTLTQPDLLSINISTTGFTCQTNGSATALVTGGTGIYNYQWNDALNSSTADISNLAPGDYQLFVTDSNGCTAIANTTILDESITNCQISVLNTITTIDGAEGHLQADAAGVMAAQRDPSITYQMEYIP